MFPFGFRSPVDCPVVDPHLFRDAMNRPAVAREFFLPLDRAWWDASRFTLGRWGRSVRGPALRGVRLQEPRPPANGVSPERDTRDDLGALIGSVIELRRVPQLSGLVLSDETVIGWQQGKIPGKRVQFGLSCDPFGRFQAEAPAAAECHRVLQRAMRRAGFKVAHPKEPFDPSSGLAGLREWAGTVRLRRGRVRGAAMAILFLALTVGLLFVPLPGTPSVKSLMASNAAPAPSATPPAVTPPVVTPPAPTKPGVAPPAGFKAPGAPPAAAKAPGTPPAGAKTDPYQEIKEIEEQLKQLQQAAGGNANGLPSLTGGGLSDGSARKGVLVSEAGVAAYLVGGAWLLWAAPDAGFGALMGLLLLPGYGFVVARSAWSRTWLPLLIHMGGLVLVLWGTWLVFEPYYRMLQGLVG
jgi:hypothetical protein